MSEEKKEKWLNYLALSTVIFAVCATLSTFKGGGYGSKALLNQTNAANKWSQYQSKSIKGYLFKNQVDNLEIQMDIASNAFHNKEILEKYQVKIEKYNKELKRYEVEKDSIKTLAESFETTRDECQKHGNKFGIAVIFLQVCILLSSIAGLMKKRLVWYLSLIVGIFGLFFFIDGFFLLL
jgi:hypothetical protein